MRAYALKCANCVEGDGARTASAYGDAGKRIRTNDEDGVDLSLIKRQQLVVVLEKNYALASSIERNSVILRIEERDGRVGLGAVEPAKAGCGTQRIVSNFLIDGCLLDLGRSWMAGGRFLRFMKAPVGISRSSPPLAAATAS